MQIQQMALFGPTTVRKETETENLRNLCILRIFPNSLPFNDRFKTICGLSTQVRQLHPSMVQTAAA
jgi:hypothetical protein